MADLEGRVKFAPMRDRWAAFTDAELLALREVLRIVRRVPDIRGALYREVCAAIDARPSCVLRAGGAS